MREELSSDQLFQIWSALLSALNDPEYAESVKRVSILCLTLHKGKAKNAMDRYKELNGWPGRLFVGNEIKEIVNFMIDSVEEVIEEGVIEEDAIVAQDPQHELEASQQVARAE